MKSYKVGVGGATTYFRGLPISTTLNRFAYMPIYVDKIGDHYYNLCRKGDDINLVCTTGVCSASQYDF